MYEVKKITVAAQIINVEIKGYWRDKNKTALPEHSGIYFVYESIYNPEDNTVALKRLIYIGESADVKDRILKHEMYSTWKRYVEAGSELVFSSGPVDPVNRNRVEAAYINYHKPPANTSCLNSFNYDQTTVVSTGKVKFLDKTFTVFRTF
jgi:hypothetical protein